MLGFDRIKKKLSEIHHCWLSGGLFSFGTSTVITAVTEFPCVPPPPPQDVQYSDIDYMERQLDFTLDRDFAGFPALITRMKADGMRVILILVSPQVNGRSLFGEVNGF